MIATARGPVDAPAAVDSPGTADPNGAIESAGGVDAPPGTITLRRDRLLLRWPDGEAAVAAADLRAACRCAECRTAALRGNGRQRTEITLTGAAPVGSYALQLAFSDRHDRGIYPWSLLRDLSGLTNPFSIIPP